MTRQEFIKVLFYRSSHSFLDKTIVLETSSHLKRLWTSWDVSEGFIYSIGLLESVYTIDDGTVEYIVNSFIALSRSFVDCSQIKPLGQLNCLIERDLPLIWGIEVWLISHQDYVACYLLRTIRNKVLNLLLYQIEARSARDVINCDAPMWVSVVSLGNRAKSLLTCRVPYLHLDNLFINGQGLYLEINSNRTEIPIIVSIFCKSH